MSFNIELMEFTYSICKKRLDVIAAIDKKFGEVKNIPVRIMRFKEELNDDIIHKTFKNLLDNYSNLIEDAWKGDSVNYYNNEFNLRLTFNPKKGGRKPKTKNDE